MPIVADWKAIRRRRYNVFWTHRGRVGGQAVAPKASLGGLLLAATAIDTLSGVFVLTGVETIDASGASSIPWSHGLFMAVVWAIAGTAIAFLISRDRRTSLVIGLLVFSHAAARILG